MNKLRIEDMSKDERPCERILSDGPEYLSDAELLAIILRTGSTEGSAINLAQQILNLHPVYKGVAGLNYLTPMLLKSLHGVGDMKAAQIIAVTELSKRISESKHKDSVVLSDPESVANYFMERGRYLENERVYALFLSSSNAVIHDCLISTGSVNSAMVPVRELLLEALKYGAVSMVLVHNHPSGNPEPSMEDVVITKRITDAGKLIGVPLIDHIIIGDKIYISLKERDLL